MEFEAEVEPRAFHVPGWYWAVAIACLLFELLGCYAYITQVTTDPATPATAWWTCAAIAGAMSCTSRA